MKLNRKWILIVSLVLSVAMATSGTLAYLQDHDEDVNVMTLGSVHIKQHEYERAVDADGKYKTDTIDGVTSYVLKDFTQGKPLLPIVGDPSSPQGYAYAGWDNTVVRMSQVDSYGGMQVFAGKNAQDKFVTVENTGKSDAYVRTIIALEVGSSGNADLIGTSYHGTWTENEIGSVTIDDNQYKVIEYVYAGGKLDDGSWRHEGGILPAGDTTYPNLSQVYLGAEATNEDLEALDGNGNGTFDILVLSQAVQAAGFPDAKTALDTAFGKTVDKAAEWFNPNAEGPNKFPAIPVTVDTADELVEALENGKDVVLTDDIKIDPAGMSNAYGTTGINVKKGQTIDGNGHTLDIKGAGGTWDSGICTSGGLIKDLTVTGSFRGIFVKKDTNHNERVILENVKFDGCTYTISVDSGTGEGLTATDSTFKGWTSFAGTLGDAKFVNCTFGEGSGNNFSRPYAPTEYVNCAFEAGHRLDARAAVTFENCTLDGAPLTADNLATLVHWNIDNATVK